jgi:hypothetical protein
LFADLQMNVILPQRLGNSENIKRKVNEPNTKSDFGINRSLALYLPLYQG